jgi:hypothetical protein
MISMKNKLYMLCAIMGVWISACQKEYKEIGEVPSKVEGITANWVLQACEVVDKGGFVEETMDITSFFYTKTNLPNIQLAMVNGAGVYTADTSNIAFQFFGGTSGTWTFDNPNFPKQLILTPTGSSTNLVFPLATTIRPTDTNLKLDKSILCKDTEKAVYRLSFIRK